MNNFSSYLVSFDTGFVLERKDRIELPSYYDPWIELKNNLEDLMNSDSLWKYVDQMAVLSDDYLISQEELCYGHSLLSMITASYVWYKRSVEIPKVLPKSISVPLRNISDRLGIKPILTHMDLILINTVVDKTMKFSDKGCVTTKETIIKNSNWEIFQTETARIEICFAQIIKAGNDIITSILKDELETVILSLKIISSTLNSMKETMNGFHEMNPDYFHIEMRPFLTGWCGASFPYEGGLLYENEDGSMTQIECIGASAAQSLTLQFLDALFKIQHSTESQKFFDEMKQYMLRQHRNFLSDVQNFVHLPDFINKNIHNEELIKEYNECLKRISLFRTSHMSTVTRFIINPAKKISKMSNKSEFLQERGTGGQELLKFLKEVRDDTNKKKISDDG